MGKIVFITDRTDLEEQLSGTSSTIGFTVKVADRIRELSNLIPGESADLIMAMIHKFQDKKRYQLWYPGWDECQRSYPDHDRWGA